MLCVNKNATLTCNGEMKAILHLSVSVHTAPLVLSAPHSWSLQHPDLSDNDQPETIHRQHDSMILTDNQDGHRLQ